MSQNQFSDEKWLQVSINLAPVVTTLALGSHLSEMVQLLKYLLNYYLT